MKSVVTFLCIIILLASFATMVPAMHTSIEAHRFSRRCPEHRLQLSDDWEEAQGQESGYRALWIRG